MPKLSIFLGFIIFLNRAHQNKATHNFLHFYHMPIFSYEIALISTFIEINKILKIEKGPLGFKAAWLGPGRQSGPGAVRAEWQADPARPAQA
jgi:hypothetical protein